MVAALDDSVQQFSRESDRRSWNSITDMLALYPNEPCRVHAFWQAISTSSPITSATDAERILRNIRDPDLRHVGMNPQRLRPAMLSEVLHMTHSYMPWVKLPYRAFRDRRPSAYTKSFALQRRSG